MRILLKSGLLLINIRFTKKNLIMNGSSMLGNMESMGEPRSVLGEWHIKQRKFLMTKILSLHGEQLFQHLVIGKTRAKKNHLLELTWKLQMLQKILVRWKLIWICYLWEEKQDRYLMH